MALKIPDSMEELVYWTNRTIGAGKVKAWVNREKCPACHKSLMGKPKGDNGKVKIRASSYECPSCSHRIDKAEYEPTLSVEIIYTCPMCNFSGETVTPYLKKKVKGVESVIFLCEKCKEKIAITKKMKAIKDKKAPVENYE